MLRVAAVVAVFAGICAVAQANLCETLPSCKEGGQESTVCVITEDVCPPCLTGTDCYVYRDGTNCPDFPGMVDCKEIFQSRFEEAVSKGPTPSPSETNGSPSPDSNGGSTGKAAQCNLNRGSLETNDKGEEVCVCASGWEGPPRCDQWPIWKWLASIGGGVAALLSILISIRAFLAGRKKKHLEESDLPMSSNNTKDDDVETLHITPHRRSAGASSTQYKRDTTPNAAMNLPAAPPGAGNTQEARSKALPPPRTVHSDPDREFTL